MKLLQTRIETFIKHIQSTEFSQLYYSFKKYVIIVPSNSNSEFTNMLVQPINACVLICFDCGCSTIDVKGIWGQNVIPVFITFSKFYGERALYIQNFTVFCSAFSKVCEFGLKDVIYTYKCMKNFTPGFPSSNQQVFINQIFHPFKWIKIRPTWKKICFQSNGLKKTHPGSPKIIFFSQKLQFRYFLK